MKKVYDFLKEAEVYDLRAMYDENDGNTQVLYFEEATATFSSFTAPEEVVKFQHADDRTGSRQAAEI